MDSGLDRKLRDLSTKLRVEVWRQAAEEKARVGRRVGRKYTEEEFKDRYAIAALFELEDLSLPIVKRQVLHWESPETQEFCACTGHGFPLNEEAAKYFHLESLNGDCRDYKHWLEDVEVPMPDERFRVHWKRGEGEGTLPFLLSPEAVEYYIIRGTYFDKNIPKTIFTIEEIPENK